MVPPHSKSINVWNYLPTVHTLILHPPLSPCQPFSCSHSNKPPPYIRPLLILQNLYVISNPEAHAEKLNPFTTTTTTTFDQMPKDAPSLLRSSVNLGWGRRQKAKQMDAFIAGRRGCKGGRVRANLKLGSTERTQAVRTQRGRDGCLWSW